MTLAARVAGMGLVGPGVASWPAAREVLAGRAPFESRPTVIPSPEALPPTERRRASKGVRLALTVGLEAAAASGIPERELAAVFTSSSGDGDNCHSICEALASNDRLISPTRFHNSVHNAPAGYWGIATSATHAADCLAAFDASPSAGLLEALARLHENPARPVLLVAYDVPYPEPLAATRPIAHAFAVGLVLVAADRAGSGPRLDVSLERGADPPRLADGALEALQRSVPAARMLPLLGLLAREAPGRACLEYLGGLSLCAVVTA